MKKAKILVVEDEGIMALALTRKLENFGYSAPVTVSTGEEAVQMTKKVDFDLILMDIILEGEMDGIEAATIIAEQSEVPVIYLTANSDLTTFRRAKATNPAGYILKPFDDEQLHSTINMSLCKSRMKKEMILEDLGYSNRPVGDRAHLDFF